MIFTCVYSEVEGARPVYLKEPDHDHGIFCWTAQKYPKNLIVH